MSTGISIRRIKLVTALGFALVGVVLAWRSLGPMGSDAFVNTTPNDASAPVESAPKPSFPLPTSLSVEVTAENAGQIADELTDRFRSQLDGAVGYRLRDSDAQPLLAEANTLLQITLGGSFEQYAAHQRSTGASNPILDSGDADKIAKYKYIWSEMTGVVSQHPISIEDAIVRPRYIDGDEINQPDLGATAWITAQGRYKIREDPVKGKLTIYEFIVPVLYEYEKVKGPAWWGVWLAKAPGSEQWVQVRSVMYDPAAIDAGVVPTF